MAGVLANPSRLTGIDAARGLALLGMMVTHLIPLTEAGSTTWAIAFAGRASALFAVLAGVSLALSVRPESLREPRGWLRQAAGVAARAGVIIAIGLSLGELDSGLAVILVHYGVLFLLAASVLRLPAGWLGGLGVAWLLLMPVALHAIRAAGPLPAFDYDSPAWTGLADPAQFFSGLLVTGYYPVLSWFGYILVGMALGRTDLRRASLALSLAFFGAGAALAAKAASAALLLSGGVTALEQVWEHGRGLRAFSLEYYLEVSGYGTTPANSWWWLAVSGPHTGTPFDLLHTAGVAVAVIGVACALCQLHAGRVLVAPLSWAGRMPLTLYTAHVCAMVWRDVADPELLLLLHIGGALVFAAGWQLVSAGVWGAPRRGPLEAVAAAASRAARTRVGRPQGSN